MKKKIAILGSTGSIGKTLLEIIRKDKKNFEITLLTANRNYKETIKQDMINYINNKESNITYENWLREFNMSDWEQEYNYVSENHCYLCLNYML